MSQPSTRAQVITRRSYNRPTNELGTIFETWDETVNRVIQHQRNLWEDAKGKKLSKDEEKELEELRGLMLRREAVTSGRTLWLGGTEIAKRRASSQFNCSFSLTSTVHDVVDHFWLLLQGCGVGHSANLGILNGFTKPVEEIKVVRSAFTVQDWEDGNRGDEHNKERYYKKNGKRIWHLTIGDSAEAWAKAVGKIMAIKKPIDVIVLDFSQIRAGGIRLKGYGWISSGDTKFVEALTAICKIMSESAGRLLTRINILDIENWLGTTLSSRRSAEISLCPFGDPEWEEFASAKHEYWVSNIQREQSNNSLLFYSRPTKEELTNIFDRMVKAGGSEPGFINAAAALKRGPWFKGCNPCVTGDTLVMTAFGPKPIKCLVGKACSVVVQGKVLPTAAGATQDGIPYSLGAYPTGVKEVWRLVTQEGYELKATPDHKIMSNGEWKALSDFSHGDPVDLAIHAPFHNWNGRGNFDDGYAEAVSIDPFEDEIRPSSEFGSYDFYRGFMKGIFRCRRASDIPWLKSKHKAGLQVLQRMLLRLGKLSVITASMDEDCTQVYTLDLNHPDNFALQSQNVPKHQAHVDYFEVCGEEEVYDITVGGPHEFDANGIRVHNCAEILLGDKSFCNLIEVDLGKFNGRYSELLRAVYIMARANYRQTCVNLKDGVLQDSWHELNEFLRLCGVGITGIVRWELSKDPAAYRDIRHVAIQSANSMATQLNLPLPKAVTTVKPSGTLSKIMDTTEGAHRPLGKYIFNNVNFSVFDPLVAILKKANYRVIAHPTDSSGVIITFPVCYEDVEFTQVTLDNGRTVEVNTETAIEQLERYKLLMDNYVDHNCSITISYDPSEFPAIVDWIYDNWNHYVGVSFLFRNDPTKTAADLGYLYLPQEVTTKEEYDAYVSTLLPVNLNHVEGPVSDLEQECANGICPIR